MYPNMEFIGTLQKTRFWYVKVSPSHGGRVLFYIFSAASLRTETLSWPGRGVGYSNPKRRHSLSQCMKWSGLNLNPATLLTIAECRGLTLRFRGKWSCEETLQSHATNDN